MKTETIGRRLAWVRHMSGLPASKLGKLAGLSHATVAMIERGQRPDPSSSVVGKLAGILGVSTDWLISGEGDEPEEETVLAAVAAAEAEGDAA